MKAANLYKRRDRRRLARRLRVRKKIRGTAERPRLVVYRSNRYIYAQIIDDRAGHTLAAASTREAEIAEGLSSTKDKTAAAAVGRVLAERAKAKGIERVVFDKGWYRYHGRIKALADAAREAGLEF